MPKEQAGQRRRQPGWSGRREGYEKAEKQGDEVKAKVENYTKGIFYYGLPGLNFSERRLELAVEEGKRYHGSFFVSNDGERPMEGVLFCAQQELELLVSELSGVSAEIPFVVHAEYLECGTTLSGSVDFVGDLGECSLPYEIRVVLPQAETSIGRISDLFRFAELAQEQWQEAVRLFASPEFSAVFLRERAEERAVYECLKKSSSMEQAMEEFLLWLRKKPPVVLSVEEGETEYHLGRKVMRDHLTIRREGWGYVDAEVEADAPFIRLEKQRLTWEDFPGGICELSFLIDPDQAYTEKGSAEIRIRTADQELSTAFSVFFAGTHRQAGKKSVRKKDCWLRLMKNLLRYRLGRWDSAGYAEDGRAVLYRLEMMEETDLCRLAGIHLNLEAGRKKEADEALSEMRGRRTELDPLSLTLFLFLRYQVEETEQCRKEALQTVMERATEYPAEFLSLSLYLQLTDGKRGRPEDVYRLLKQSYSDGCRSPFLYLECWELFEAVPEVFSQLSDFEIQVFHWSRKQGLFSKAAAARYVYLAENEKRGQHLIFRYLTYCYEHGEQRDVLNSVCILLLRGIYRSRDAFCWYQRGIRAGLKLTGLYEAYMDTLDEEKAQVLEPQIYTYFSFGNDLGARKKAYLYSNILSIRKEKPQIYRNYLGQMQTFALRQLEAGEIDENLAALYEALLSEPEFCSQALPLLPRVLFRYRITCEKPGVIAVSVSNAELADSAAEESTLLERGTACVDLFTESARLILSDSRGRRFVVSKPYECRRLLQRKGLAPDCYAAGCRDYRLLLSLADQEKEKTEEEILKALTELAGLRPEYRNRMIGQWCRRAEERGGEIPAEYLGYFEFGAASFQERLPVINLILKEDLLLPADSVLTQFGFRGVDPDGLLRYCERRILSSEEEKLRPLLLSASWQLFREGKAQPLLAEYLARYGEGSVSALYELWKAVRRENIPDSGLEEHLLLLMLYTESFSFGATEVYRAVRENEAGEEGKRKLLRAFLMYEAYRYVILNKTIPEELFGDIRKEAFHEETGLCHAAVLKRLSRNDVLSDEDAAYAEVQMERLAAAGSRFPFFRDFQGKCLVPAQARHKSYVTWAAVPEAVVEISFRLTGKPEEEAEPEREDGKDYRTERMERRFLGFFVREFLLFHGEVLKYFITVEENGRTERKGPFLLSAEKEPAFQEAETDGRAGQEDAYGLLNRIAQADQAGDPRLAEELTECYLKQVYRINRLFGPL